MPGPSREKRSVNPDFRDMLSAFSDAGVEYLLVGAYALAVHGLPRATGDIDIWIRPTPENARRSLEALASFGAPLNQLTAEDLSTQGTVFQIGLAPRRIDVLTSIDGVSFETAWENHLTVLLDRLSIPVIGKEDLILNKRSTGRTRDLADAEQLEALGE
jgi:hypothetical protein